jgi:ribosomal protein L5
MMIPFKPKIFALSISACPQETSHVNAAKTLFQKTTGLKTNLMVPRYTDHGLKIKRGVACGFFCKFYGKTARTLVGRFKPEFFGRSIGQYGSLTRGYESYTDFLGIRQDPYTPDFGLSISVVVQWPGYGATKRRRAPAKVSTVSRQEVTAALISAGAEIYD